MKSLFFYELDGSEYLTRVSDSTRPTCPTRYPSKTLLALFHQIHNHNPQKAAPAGQRPRYENAGVARQRMLSFQNILAKCLLLLDTVTLLRLHLREHSTMGKANKICSLITAKLKDK